MKKGGTTVYAMVLVLGATFACCVLAALMCVGAGMPRPEPASAPSPTEVVIEVDTPTPEPPTPTATPRPSPTPPKTETVSADDQFLASLVDFQDDIGYLGAQFNLLADHLADQDAPAMCSLADEVHPRAVTIMEKSFDMPTPEEPLLRKAQEHLWDALIAWATSWANLKNGFCEMFDPWYLEGVTGQLEIGNDYFLQYNLLLEEYRELRGQ